MKLLRSALMGIGVAKAPAQCLAAPTLAPTPPALIEGFTYVGEKSCVDASGNEYSYINVEFPLPSNDNECIKWCSQNLHPDFVGVQIDYDYESSELFCDCLFSGGLPNGINPRVDYSPAAFEFESFDGSGPVQSFPGPYRLICYRYNVSCRSSSFVSALLLLLHPLFITTSSSLCHNNIEYN
jgi:hypothetical protein